MPVVKTVTTTVENFGRPTRRSSRRDELEDALSKDTLSRRQDQRIKDDITNKLYRLELERVKPGVDVQLQTANFRSNVNRPRSRHYTPEPGLHIKPRTQTFDSRRFSTAGNLDIYRPKTQQIQYTFESPPHIESSKKVEYIRSSTAPVPTVPSFNWRAYVHDSGRTNDLLSDYDLRKEAEMRVRGRSNGPLVRTREITYAPLVLHQRHSSTPPPEVRYAEHRPASSSYKHALSAGRKVSDGQYELDQFEKLMKRTFGSGGVNRNKTLLYTSPAYASTYEYTLPYTYSTTPVVSSTYYSGRPYYSGNYSYPYYSQPYYVSSYAPYHYYEPRSVEYEYPLYSPPTRVTAPGDRLGYYNNYYHGRSALPSNYTYTYVR